MKMIRYILILMATLWLVACKDEEVAAPTPTPPPTAPVVVQTPTLERPASPSEIEFITVAMDVPDKTGRFGTFDTLGNIVGFDADIMAAIAANAGIEYEIVATPFDNLFENIAAGHFDAVLSAVIIPDQPQANIVFTRPYLEVDQLLLVLADNEAVNGPTDVTAAMRVGVVEFSAGQQAAQQVLGVSAEQIVVFEDSAEALQALIVEGVDAVVAPGHDAEAYATQYFQQVKLAGNSLESSRLLTHRYGLAVAADNPALLQLLNDAILKNQDDGTFTALTEAQFVTHAQVVAGESRIGTPDDKVVVGVVGTIGNFDPGLASGFFEWELATNTMGGLMMLDADNNLVPALATGLEVSPDGLVYTFGLREGLTFADGTPFNADAVKKSIDRIIEGNVNSSIPWNWHINSFLKDSNEDGFADPDAVIVGAGNVVRFTLQEPTAFFPSLLATPPYFIVNPACETATFDPMGKCDSIGRYQITHIDPERSLTLQANPNWPGAAPVSARIDILLYDSQEQMTASLTNDAIDVAWIGLSPADANGLATTGDYSVWPGSDVFKSHLLFNQALPPWDNLQVRQAAALAVDREALAALFGGDRNALFSPVPDSVVGHVSAEAPRDVDQARTLLTQAGYSESTKLPIQIYYINDGRYTSLEGQYAVALKAQLEETRIFEVEIIGAPWNQFRPNIAGENCSYPAFLHGWPTPNTPIRYSEPLSWMYYFMSDSLLCLNFQSEALDTLYTEAVTESREAARQNVYRQIQGQWAQEVPGINLTQESQAAISLTKVTNLQIDAIGLMHYETLTK